MNILEQYHQLKQRLSQMRQKLEIEEKRIDELLKTYAETHRKYPNGYQFTLNGRQVIISHAIGAIMDKSFCIVYGLMDENGQPFDALIEKNVNHPDYI